MYKILALWLTSPLKLTLTFYAQVKLKSPHHTQTQDTTEKLRNHKI